VGGAESAACLGILVAYRRTPRAVCRAMCAIPRRRWGAMSRGETSDRRAAGVWRKISAPKPTLGINCSASVSARAPNGPAKRATEALSGAPRARVAGGFLTSLSMRMAQGSFADRTKKMQIKHITGGWGNVFFRTKRGKWRGGMDVRKLIEQELMSSSRCNQS